MDLRTMIINGAVLLMGLGLLMSGVGWAVRQQALLTRDEIRDTVAADLSRLLMSLGRCVDLLSTTTSPDPPSLSFPIRSCAVVHSVNAGQDPDAPFTLHFASRAEASALIPAYILARRIQGSLILERNGCHMEILEKPTLSTPAGRVKGLCPPRTNGSYLATVEGPRGRVWVRLQAQLRAGLKISFHEGNWPPFYQILMRDLETFDITYVVGTKRFLIDDGSNELFTHDLDADDNRVLTLNDRPVIRPFLKRATSGIVLHFPVKSPYTERFGTRCGRHPIHAGEKKQCLEIELKPG